MIGNSEGTGSLTEIDQLVAKLATGALTPSQFLRALESLDNDASASESPTAYGTTGADARRYAQRKLASI